MNVPLIPKIELLNEVIVLNEKQKYKTKSNNLKTGKRKIMFPISVPFGYETGTLIENKKKKKGKLIELSLKLKNATRENFTIHQTYYRLSFYKADRKGFPSELLNYENIIIKPESNAMRFIIDLEDKNIAFNKNGIFIGIETVKPDDVEPSSSIYLTTPNIMYTHTDKKITYTRFGSNKWSKNNRVSAFKTKLYKVPFIKVKVSYLE